MGAACHGNKNVVSLLLGAGADVNKADRLNCTPLIYAARNGHEDEVKILLDAGANPNIPEGGRKNAFNVGCLQWSQKCGHSSS